MNLLRISLIAFVPILTAPPASAGPVADRLATLVGKPAMEIKAAFGEATVEEAFLLRYSYNQPGNLAADGLPPNRPAPLDGGIGPAGRFSGIAPGARDPRDPGLALPCSISFELDAANMVVSTAHSGPGCFEIVFSRTKPQ
ncbi:MAG: hypothetical protein ACU84Q_16580 [Gammaproteobacteria bacterium]